MADTLPILYGMPGSLYTGKARAYLRRRRIAYEEYPAGGARYGEHVLPRIGRWIIPVVELPDGTLIQDSADIIEHFERVMPAAAPAVPPCPVLETLTRIFDLYGGEGMLRAAMHYRWDFDADNLAFLRSDFGSALSPGASAEDAEARFGLASMLMRRASVGLGVTPETAPLIEQSYGEFLDLFEAHLAQAPFVMGGAPTLGDYGLIGPLYAHLARDPAPAMLMKQRAPRVWRWVERMNAPEPGNREYGDVGPALFDAAALPATLMALLRFVAADYLAEVEAFVAAANDYLAERQAVPVGELRFDKPGQRAFRTVSFAWRGVPITVPVMLYRILMLQRIQDAADCGTGQQVSLLREVLAELGLSALLDARVTRRVERVDHLEVWGGLNPHRGGAAA